MARILTRRWLVWHVTYLLCLATCVVCAIWQLDRAESPTGDWQNWVYVVQWPFFAVIGTWGYWRSIQLELHPPQDTKPLLLHDDDEGRVVHFVAQRALTADPHDFTAAEPENPALAAYNARLAALAAADREATASEQRLPS